jgi:spermidine synthase
MTPPARDSLVLHLRNRSLDLLLRAQSLTRLPAPSFVTTSWFFSVLYFLSGFSALIYQVVWQRLLTLHYGVGPVSVTLIVSLFMAGLGLGAYLGGHMAERVQNRLRLYLAVELSIGIFGCGSLYFLTVLSAYIASSSPVISFAALSTFLLLPTLLMGMTFPILTKAFADFSGDFGGNISHLYFVNTLGAALGALISSYVFISFLGLDGALYIAAALNLLLAAAILLVPRLRSPRASPRALEAFVLPSADRLGSHAHLVVFVTGFLAIGYQLLWFRFVGVLVKDSPYAFSSILSVYLMGIALGSFWINRLLHRRTLTGLKDRYFSLQFLIGLSTAVVTLAFHYLNGHTAVGKWVAFSFGRPVHPPLFETFAESPLAWLVIFADVFLWSAFFFFLPTFLMGASFPLASVLSHDRPGHEGLTVGKVYFFNVSGNVLGGVISGFFLLPALGSERTALIFSLTGVAFGLLVGSWKGRPISRTIRMAGLAVIVLALCLLMPGPGELIKGIHADKTANMDTYLSEGVEGVVVTATKNERVLNFLNGQAHGNRPSVRFYQEAVEAMSFSRSVTNPLIIGYGTGSTTEAVAKSHDVARITVVELNDTLMRNLRQIPLFQDLLGDPRIHLLIEDGRRYLLTRETILYDMILLDPLRTTTAYSNNLYSKEFFDLVRTRLRPGGVLMLWLDEFKVLPRTVASVFDHVRLYNYFLIASADEFHDHPERRRQIMSQFPEPLREKIKDTPPIYLGDRAFILRNTQGYPINQDWKPRTEYYLGSSLSNLLNIRTVAAK